MPVTSRGESRRVETPCPLDLQVGEKIRIVGKTCARETRDPTPERTEGAVAGSLPCRAGARPLGGDRPAHQRPVIALHRDELRERGAHRQIARVACGDAAKQRRDEAIGRLATEAPDREVGDGLVVVALEAPGGDERLERHAQLAERGEDRGADERRHPCGHAEHQTVGDRVKAIVPGDEVSARALAGADDRVLEADLPRQGGGVRLGRYPRVGPCVEQESSGGLRDQIAAELPRLLEHRHDDRPAPVLREEQRLVSRGEAGDAAAHDRDPERTAAVVSHAGGLRSPRAAPAPWPRGCR